MRSKVIPGLIKGANGADSQSLKDGEDAKDKEVEWMPINLPEKHAKRAERSNKRHPEEPRATRNRKRGGEFSDGLFCGSCQGTL